MNLFKNAMQYWKINLATLIMSFIIIYYQNNKLKQIFYGDFGLYLSVYLVSYIIVLFIKKLVETIEPYQFDDEYGYECKSYGGCQPVLNYGESYNKCKRKCNPSTNICNEEKYQNLPINDNKIIENFPFYLNGNNYHCDKIHMINSRPYRTCIVGPYENKSKNECSEKCDLK